MDLTQYETLLKKFDVDKNKIISRTELWKTFQENKVSMTKPFASKIATALKNLNFATIQSYEFSNGDFEYYNSSPDHIRPYYEADSFC